LPVAFAFLLALSLFPAIGFARQSREYKCTPIVKYECSADQCERVTSDFQHAESFSYKPATGTISACLWTNCYKGSAAVFKDTSSRSLTAVGKLMPSAHPGNKPIIISLTIETSGNRIKNGGHFTAIWGYGSDWLTFDMGKCERQKPDGIRKNRKK
jgi:hypothetical protein